MRVTPVLLCGGSGTRLWPLSRKSYPKQFARLGGGESLFQAAARRTAGEGFRPPVAVTGEDFRFIVRGQLEETGIKPGTILIEPEPRNTAPALLAAALQLAAANPEALLLAVPCDHVIPDEAAFRAAVARGLPAAKAGRIVTFGVPPASAETGYGWLELAADAAQGGGGVLPLARFVEKPARAEAEAMFAAGRHLWNAGMILTRAGSLIAAADRHAPDLIAPVCAAVDARRAGGGEIRLAAEPWQQVRSVSADYALLEKAEDLCAVPFEGAWRDVGDWASAGGEALPGACNVSVSGPATALECENTVLRSEAEGLEIVGLGLKDVIAVAMPDAVLVADAARAQEVGLAVAALKRKNARQAEHLPRGYQPWGWSETLAGADRFQVQRLRVGPGAALPRQSHVHRAEHWVVVSGTARVTIGNRTHLLTENESAYVPLGVPHRLENPGKVPVEVIAVQTGAYLGEDGLVAEGTETEEAHARA
ncbi:mannose-1-phosphate guanylyltransferase/mannose-6-phosphate isomerase (plasmid) [Roseobacteraceae bacterium NS-SX3]